MMVSAYGAEREKALSIETVTALSRAVAAEYDPSLQVVGVASTNGESGRVELLATIRGCHQEPCVIMLNVTRLGEGAFEKDLREKFRDALASHVTST